MTLIAALTLAAVHIFAGRLGFLDRYPRSAVLSGAGGAAVAYVFVHVLPELGLHQQQYQASADFPLPSLEHHVYLLALVGLGTFYGLERLVKMDRRRNRAAGERDRTSPHMFWVHTGFFLAYNVLIGYLLVHRDAPGVNGFILYWLAMALHFLVNDHALRQDNRWQYDHTGRWVLGLAVVVGWVVGMLQPVHPAATMVLFSFLAGAIILNALKEELPEERQSRFWTFALGSVLYAALAVFI